MVPKCHTQYQVKSMTENISGRRSFLRGAATLSALSYSRILGANERIQLGAIGVGERGRHDMSRFQKDPTVDVVAVCDIYAQQIDKALQAAPKATSYSDHRKLLENKAIDVVLIATPDQWHATTA